MYNCKRFISTLIAASIVAAVTSNSNALNNELLSLNDITPQIIYVQENDEYTPFLKISDNYDGNTLLLRQDVLDITMPIDENNSYYESSMIDDYLNNCYIDTLNIKDDISKSSVIITNESSIGTMGNQSKEITRRVFLLSAQELGLLSKSAYEGDTIRYFRNPKNRSAYLNGKAIGWWTRTPNTAFDTTSYLIGTDMNAECEESKSQNGIRPAICIPTQDIIRKSDEIIKGKTVFVI